MKRFLLTIVLLLCGFPLFAQYAYRIVPVPSLPATCLPQNGEVRFLTTPAGSIGIYQCTSLNTWKSTGIQGNQFVLNQGTLTASLPFMSHTATWNNGAVTFQNFVSNITDTASNALSTLIDLQAGGISQFNVTKSGLATFPLWSSVQGTLAGASTPFLNHSVTWNNAGTTFDDILTNVTDTASNAASTLLNLKVGGNSMFSVIKTGQVTSAASIFANSTNALGFQGSTRIFTAANGRFNFTNSANTTFDRLTLGLESVAFPSVAVSPAVGGQSQGIIIFRGDGTAQVQANLGAATNGSMIYCSDCTIANPCAGGGTGAIAKRLNGAWVCN